MKKPWRILLIVSLVTNLVLTSLVVGKPKPKVNQTVTPPVIVSRVIDGDTFEANVNAKPQIIRLVAVDAPEYPEGCLAKQAKNRLTELILGKEITLVTSGQDNFGRTLAWVTVNTLAINSVMAEEGLVIVDERYMKDGEKEFALYETGQRAKEAKRGIWSSQCTGQKEGCVIKGNYHKGTKDKVYHLPECYNYQQIVINPNENDHWFCSEAEAEAAGFTKSKDCPSSN